MKQLVQLSSMSLLWMSTNMMKTSWVWAYHARSTLQSLMVPSTAALNDADADSGKTSGDRRKGQKRSNHRSGGKPGTPDGGKSRTAGNKPSSKRQGNNTK